MTEDNVCPWRHGYLIDNFLRRLIHNPKKMLGSLVTPGMTVIDVGCGMGVFSLGMARLVGSEGRVFAVDLQEEMLRVLEKRAVRAGLSDTIRTHKCGSTELGLDETVDFILAFYMVHEVPDHRSLLHQLRSRLKPNGKLLIAEPKFHVSEALFAEILESAASAGLAKIDPPKIIMSRTALFEVKKEERVTG